MPTIEQLRARTFHHEPLVFTLDASRIAFPEGFFESMETRMQAAFAAMRALEGGAIANPDEKRQVGHYWLRAADLAPTPELTSTIERTAYLVAHFAESVHRGHVKPERAGRFENALVVGIGGSALGPQFIADSLGSAGDRMRLYFLDNTDPEGIDRVLDQLGDGLAKTLTIVISKSGGTKETRNGMLEIGAAYQRAGLVFGRHAVAVTGEGSELDTYADSQGFLARFPMWDWVGGRTSVTSAVGTLPAALQGLDVDGLLDGAAAMDELTRSDVTSENPAALLALAWFSATGGAGRKDMVLLPYRDRLAIFSKYLQQLVMESIGKRHDLDGKLVHQGIAVYGNKGSTDQHAYVQQLRDGLDNFFVTFIEVLRDRHPMRPEIDVEPGITSGDYLAGFLLGTRKALSDAGRESITITLGEADAFGVGMLVALYERAVGLYASLVNINAYHQPGVEAGKKAAAEVLKLQQQVVATLRASPDKGFRADALAAAVGTDDVETVHAIVRRLAANPDRGVVRETSDGDPWSATYRWEA